MTPASARGRAIGTRERFLAAFASIVVAGVAKAGPPFQTDDPDPPEYRHFELIVAAEYLETADGRSGSRPFVELNYGLRPDVQVGIHLPWAFNDARGASHEDGLGDVEVGLKYRVVHENGWIPAACVFPSYRSGSGDAARGLGEDGQGLELPFWVAKSLGDRASVYAGGGYRRQWTSSGSEHTWFEAALATVQVGEALTLGAELFSETSPQPHHAAAAGFDIGGLYRLGPQVRLLGSVGRGISEVTRSNELSAFVGLQLVY